MTAATKTWRVGVIGTGKHGSRYAHHIIEDVEGLSLAAISRRSQQGQEQARQWGCRWLADWRQLILEPEVDAVVATLPPGLNREVAAACAQAGKPLLLEKPMAVSVRDAEAICEDFLRMKVPLTIGQTLRYNRVVGILRDCLGRIGPLYGFSANQRLEPATLSWLDEPSLAGAGVSLQTAVHVFDALRFMTGQEIIRVLARTQRRHAQQLEDQLIVLVELENGVIGTVDCSKVGTARSGRFEFIGGLGQLHGDQVHHCCTLIHGQDRIVLDPREPVSTIVPLLTQWLGFLRGEMVNPVAGEEGVAAVRVAEACLRSAARERWEPVALPGTSAALSSQILG
ncbi:Gfo/Idh/MocA family protein [Desulfobulbus alkaliphilus]|uniref:Gfo/Idh/MocA family protein n=1 Tax=Desulfobulbus alkaliphilus TaxID=869814 RepID=UPI0019648422|nr:Gfo/Idh/MocA family oxidoreductase [Desulfobulbus alkaliphilus]MBM9537201.1 Gfo/Idh/MocA family oxidoreductase [Desulfobulbus alkaliphilus]